MSDSQRSLLDSSRSEADPNRILVAKFRVLCSWLPSGARSRAGDAARLPGSPPAAIRPAASNRPGGSPRVWAGRTRGRVAARRRDRAGRVVRTPRGRYPNIGSMMTAASTSTARPDRPTSLRPADRSPGPSSVKAGGRPPVGLVRVRGQEARVRRDRGRRSAGVRPRPGRSLARRVGDRTAGRSRPASMERDAAGTGRL